MVWVIGTGPMANSVVTSSSSRMNECFSKIKSIACSREVSVIGPNASCFQTVLENALYSR